MKHRKIYLVVYSHYDTVEVVHAFFNKEKAEAVALTLDGDNIYRSYYVEECDVEDA